MTLSVYLGWSISSSLCALQPRWSGRCLPCILHSQCVFGEIFLEIERGDWTDCWPADFHLWCLGQLPRRGRQAGLDIGCIKCLPILARKLSGECGVLKGPNMPVRNAITVYFPFLGSAGFGFRAERQKHEICLSPLSPWCLFIVIAYWEIIYSISLQAQSFI